MSRKAALAIGQAGERKRSKAARELIRYGLGQTSIAAILVAISDKGVVAIVIQEHPGDEALVEALRARFPRAELRHDGAGAREMVEAVISFVEDPRGSLTLPLDIRGTDFQRRVWEAVGKIPFGRTTTFLEIARAIGAPEPSGRSAAPALRIRSSSPFHATVSCAATAPTREGPRGGTGAGDHCTARGRGARQTLLNRWRKP